MNLLHYKLANWPAPKHVHALSTTKLGGFSPEPYESNNLAYHVEDDATNVLKNRHYLASELNLPAEPAWLEQTHSTECVVIEKDAHRTADAAITRSITPLVVLTADCLPILLCNRQGSEIAAIHAGWKGLCHGIVENTINKMHSDASDLLAWIGPAICQQCYEVGDEMFHAFTNKNPLTKHFFIPNQKKWLANLPKIAELVLNDCGVKAIFQSDLCTFELKNEFYSYRRSQKTGRIGSLIWLNNQPQDTP